MTFSISTPPISSSIQVENLDQVTCTIYNDYTYILPVSLQILLENTNAAWPSLIKDNLIKLIQVSRSISKQKHCEPSKLASLPQC